ncbi:ATP-binding cassette domain-containing protein [Alcaligenaceae bacterium]|nr:ATP-binding cassette domain-containing protein [Alcaligenaceae bacterium]
MLEVARLSNGYGGAEVIADISLTIAQGESVALLGRNGAGKTTLLHSLFNIGPPCTGDIRFNGRPIARLPTHRIARHGLALVPQGRGGFPDLRVRESLGLATLAPRGPDARACTLAGIYRQFPRLHERRNTLCANLSGGERQLLALARALLTQSELIVLDECSEGLAPLAIDTLLQPELLKLRERGYTVLLAEQNIGLALAVATRVIVLSDRRIVFDGDTEAFRQDPGMQREHLGL